MLASGWFSWIADNIGNAITTSPIAAILTIKNEGAVNGNKTLH
jgi:hypothetical protein